MRNSITPLPGGRLRKEYRGTLAWKREITLLRQMAGSGLCPEPVSYTHLTLPTIA